MYELEKQIFTSESVSEGHPDKVADQISDAILDECLRQDAHAKVACETFCTFKKIIISGEIKFSKEGINLDYRSIARSVIRQIGHTKETGLDPEIEIEILINEQSTEINLAVHDNTKTTAHIGAGDQGIMFGYATDETPEFMPIPILMSHMLVQRASVLRKEGKFLHARPDMKSQVSYNYAKQEVHKIIMSIQHDDPCECLPNCLTAGKQCNRPVFKMADFKDYVLKNVILPVAKKFDASFEKRVQDFKSNGEYIVLVNPSGSFVKGGPAADTGLTGRKIIVDTYGGVGRHGGGCFSGKDATKMDRSAAYCARHIAKNIVFNQWAKRCEVQLAYVIGREEPMSINVFTFGTQKSHVNNQFLLEYIRENYKLKPHELIENLNLRKPIYLKTATYGHFGRLAEGDFFPWEKTFKSDKMLPK